MLKSLTQKIFGNSNERYIRSLQPLVQRVNDLEETVSKLSDEEFPRKTAELRSRIENGEPLSEIEPEAFALCREAAMRTLEMRHFDVQLIGGHVLHEGKIAEMKTGEGKTLVATLAAYLNGLSGRGVHVVTVNDYLAKRDAEWMGQVYRFLGLSVGCVYSRMPEDEKKAAYQADITYGQNNEFGFDYLRDNMKFRANDQFQRSHAFAIVDEVDSILIDEARTPLIISGPAEDARELYAVVNGIIPSLKSGEDFEVDLKTKNPALTEVGVAHVEKLMGVDNLYDPKHLAILHHVNSALKAHTTLQRDVDYVVNNGEVIIVDEFTGRLMPGRRWSDGLHQAVEAKEGVQIARENQTLASITFQNYFRMYEKLSGMTGTADTEASEFWEIYKLLVVVIPTNKPLLRVDESDSVYRTRKEKYEALADEVATLSKKGQPTLVGTVSIEQSETLAGLLKQRGINHQVLNAKHHEREAEIIAQAGRYKAVTISTNMAGRGTDIVLGGNAEGLVLQELGSKDAEDSQYQEKLAEYRKQCEAERQKVLEAGGLCVLGTERHESRRIDNQLRGRSGRQGDPGRTKFFISLEDDLMRRFGGEKLQAVMLRMGWEEGVSLDGRIVSRTIENAQKKVEAFHFESRKHVTEYDDVMNKQRRVVYNLRDEILKGESSRSQIHDMLDDWLEEVVLTTCDPKQKPSEWDIDSIFGRIADVSGVELKLTEDIVLNEQAIFDFCRETLKNYYDQRAEEHEQKLRSMEEMGIEVLGMVEKEEHSLFATFERENLLKDLDFFWNRHLINMDELRDGVGFRGYGQINPKHAYQREGFALFQTMLANYRISVLQSLFRFSVRDPEELRAEFEAEQKRRERIESQMKMVHEGESSEQGDEVPKNPNEQRKKVAEQKKARRRARRK